MKYLVVLMLLITLPGCKSTAPSIPKSAQGNAAHLDDTFTPVSRRSASYYVVEKIDGKTMVNGADRAQESSAGNSHLVHASMSRPLQANKTYLITLTAKTQHQAPIFSLMSDSYQVSGEVEFTPEANEFYIVTGELNADSGRVWIEDIRGNRVSPIVEKQGDSTNIDSSIPVKSSEQPGKLELFALIRPGESAESVQQRLGAPDKTEIIEGSFWGGKRDQVKHSYQGLGYIHYLGFGLTDVQPASVLEVHAAQHSNEALKTLRKSIAAGNAPELLDIAKQHSTQPAVPVMDFFAQKIWDERKTEDDTMVEAMSLMCETIGKSGNGRYRNALELIAREVESPTLKSCARNSLSKLSNGGKQFHVLSTGL